MTAATRFVRANGLRFGVVEQGPADGPLALLLHGFPDHAGTWRHLQPQLASAGHRTVAPWLRGYAPSDTGDRRHLDDLTADVDALHEVLGGDDRATLVGHDWGAAIAYRAAARAPERWRRVVTLAVPPEPVLADALTDARQVARSWYMLAAQVPGSEHLARRLAPTLWRRWSPDRPPDAADLAGLDAALPDAERWRVALDYYRTHRAETLRGRFPARRGVVPTCPVTYLHGRRDGCIGVDYAERSRAVLTGAADRVEIVEGAGHFLHLDRPDAVGALVLDALGAP